MTTDRPPCPGCGRAHLLSFDGYWTRCSACGTRHTPGAMKRAAETMEKEDA